MAVAFRRKTLVDTLAPTLALNTGLTFNQWTGLERITPQSRPFYCWPTGKGGVRGGINRFVPIDSNAEARRSSVESLSLIHI